MPTDWLLVDGSSLIFRSYHGIPEAEARAPGGHPVNAVRGTLDALARLITQRRPQHVVIAEDAAWRPDWRVSLLPSYKAHRVAEPVPPGLAPQMPIIAALFDAIGVDRCGAPDYEAEDVIATLTRAAPGRIEILSGDRDLFALVEDPRVSVLYPERSGLAVITEAEITRRYAIPGRSYADFAILRGDPSDGLPGLRGVGVRTAATLIARHGDIETLLRDGTVAADDREYLVAAAHVVRPVFDVPVALPPGHRDAYPADAAAMAELAARHGVGGSCARLVAALAGGA
jgi:5'-3' exonuclease